MLSDNVIFSVHLLFMFAKRISEKTLQILFSYRNTGITLFNFGNARIKKLNTKIEKFYFKKIGEERGKYKCSARLPIFFYCILYFYFYFT